MITKIQNKINALKEFDPDKIVLDEVKQNEDVFTELITEDQLFDRGINGRGVQISSYEPYAEFTVERKAERGQPYDRVTLRDTGAFHRSVSIKYDRDGFSFIASDEKTDDLKDKYGQEILWLTQENVNEVGLYTKDRLIKEFRNAIT